MEIVEWMNNHDPMISTLQETHFEYNEIGTLKVKG